MGRNDERKIGLLRQIKESNNTCRGRGTIADNKRGDYALKLNRTVFLFLVLVVCFFFFFFFKRHCRNSIYNSSVGSEHYSVCSVRSKSVLRNPTLRM